MRSCFRHKWKALTFFVLTMSLTIVGVVFYPRQYLSEAKLFVRVGRETATLDPTATTGHMVTVERSPEREVNSVREILKSQLIVEKVVDQLGVETLLSGARGDSGSSTVPRLARSAKQWLERLDPVSDREKATLLVRKQVRFSAPDTADTLTVSAKAATPESAEVLLQEVLEAFFTLHGRLHRTQGGHAFFEEQARLLHSQLETASRELRDAKNQYGLLTIEGQRAILDGQIESIHNRIAEVDADLAYALARASDLKRSVELLPTTVVTESTSGIGHDATDQMRTKLYELEIREKELATRYTESHPSLVAVREQLRRADQIYLRQPPQRTQTTSAMHETRQRLEVDWLGEEATVTALRSMSATLEQQRGRLETQRAALNEHALHIAELERQVEILTSDYKSYAERREEARIDQALERERISSISVIQPPTRSDRPVTPRKLPLFAVGLLLATAGAFFTVILADYLDKSFVTPAQVERQLDLPVLVSIPRMSLHRRLQSGYSS